MEKVFKKKEKVLMHKMYKDGIGIVRIGKELHTNPKKVKKILLEDYCIDITTDDKKKGNRPKPFGYWNIKENNIEAAKKCKNKKEFSDKYFGAFNAAKRNGWLEEYCRDIFTDKTNYPSYESKIHCVYAYEFNEKNSVYVGRTSSLKRRHKTHKSKTENDCVYRFSVENNVDIPYPKVLEENLNAEESQMMEHLWIEKYKDNGWNVINKARTGIGIGSLGATAPKWTYEACKKAASECKTKQEFKEKYSRAHNVSRENNWIDEFFPFNAIREKGCFDTLEGCKDACKGFSTILEIRKEYPFLYALCKKTHKSLVYGMNCISLGFQYIF